MALSQTNYEELVARMLAGNVRALSRLMTIVETAPESAPEIMKKVYLGRSPARRVGLAGPPGAGKSTLLGNLIQAAVRREQRVGVLCIDPTSPVSGGALLGDRIRLGDSFNAKNVFIRSVASGRSLGGLAEATKYHTLLLEAFGVDLILIETVGLGQVGYDIRSIAETLILILVPESGDTIQILKSGILEMTDVIVVNKADRDGADEIAATLKYAFAHARDGWKIPILQCTAREDVGTEKLWSALKDHYDYLGSTGGLDQYRDPGVDLHEAIGFQFQRRLREGLIENNPEAGAISKKVSSGEMDPYAAAMQIMRMFFKEENNG